MRKILLSMAVLAALPASANTFSDVRSMGMAGVGVASADYLTASFHNPALVTKYREDENFGMILPSVGARVHDGDDLYNKLDDWDSAYDAWEGNPMDQVLKDDWIEKTKALDGGIANIEATTAIVVALPNDVLPTSFFVQGELMTLARIDVDERDFEIEDPNKEELRSSAVGVGGAVVDIGLAMGQEFEVGGHSFRLGVSPKYQTIMALNYKESMSDVEDGEIDILEDYTSKGGFNLDIGATYDITEKWAVGLAGKNLISRELKSNKHMGQQVTFQLEPSYTIGTAYNSRYYTLAMDYDINKRSFFKEFDYESQFLRTGGEVNVYDWVQFRAGYIHSLTDYHDDMWTAGLGFTPWGVFGLEIAGQYGKDSNYGVGIQMVLKL